MTQVPVKKLKLEETRPLSPPYLDEPLYQCATAVTVLGFVPQAKLDVQVNGGTVIADAPGGFPQPNGATLGLPAPLVAGDKVRVRQKFGGITSAWSAIVTAGDHTKDFPAGPPRPQINPAPVHECGARTGVANLLVGCNVWITADGTEVGRVDGASEHQGVNVNPDYGLGQVVRAQADLCSDKSPLSQAHTTEMGPNPLPAPAFDPAYDDGEQIRITGLANGARFELSRNGSALGTWRTWGGAHLVDVSPKLQEGEQLSVTQRLCPGDPESPPGDTTVLPCSALPAPEVAPIEGGDDRVTITQMVPGATIKVYRNGVKVGEGGGPVVLMSQTVKLGDVIHVLQLLGGCVGQFAQELRVMCVAPPAVADPSSLDLFPVGHLEYDGGTVSVGGRTLHVRGSVYYPAEDDGEKQPWNKRVAELGDVPIVFMAHGNHSPADPSYLGYDYFQTALARMGIAAVSVDCNELNGNAAGAGNIIDRGDLINASIGHFVALNGGDPIFGGHLDFGRVGLMGHSRGGEAVVISPGFASLPGGVTIKCVLSLAPTDWGATSGPPTGYDFMTLLPAADGDVRDNDGAKYYDRCLPTAWKSQQYVHQANHNFFNREWLNNDNNGTLPTLPRWRHEQILLAYGCALYRASLLGHNTLRFLSGRVHPAGVLTGEVHLSFKQNKAVTVDDHQQGNTIATNSMGGATTQSGLVADEHGFSQLAGNAFNGSFFGDTVGMVAVPKRRAGGTFRSALAGRKLASLLGREIWIRAADVFEGSVAAATTGFELGLELSGGTVKWVDSDDVGGVPLPFDRGASTKTMPKTLRFKVACFGLTRAQVRSVRAIVLRLNRAKPRALAFDDLQIV